MPRSPDNKSNQSSRPWMTAGRMGVGGPQGRCGSSKESGTNGGGSQNYRVTENQGHWLPWINSEVGRPFTKSMANTKIKSL